VVGAVCVDRAVLSETGHSPPAGRGRADAAHLFLAAVVQSSDPAVEEALYNSLAMRRFVGIALGREPVADETTVCRLRHLLEEHDLGRQLFDEVQRHLTAKGLKLATCTIVVATIISAPSSTKNADKARSRDASDQEGQPVVFRHESTFLCGRCWRRSQCRSSSSPATTIRARACARRSGATATCRAPGSSTMRSRNTRCASLSQEEHAGQHIRIVSWQGIANR
jgi:Transposase domain (DUF772)